VISEYAAPSLIVPLVDAATEDLLALGRIQTLIHWLEFAERNHLSNLTLDRAEAEISFRQGRFAKAEALSSQVGRSSSDARSARMLIRAGQSAVMDSRDDQGLEYFRAASAVARNGVDQLDASVGACFAALELGLIDEADEALTALSAMEIHGLDLAVRRAIAQLVHSSRVGGLQAALDGGAAVFPLLDDVKDPLVTTSFLNCYGHLLGLGAFYVEALRIAERQIETADQYRLTFALPHGSLVRAVAHCGLRDFAKAEAEVARAKEMAAPNDIHIAMQAAALRARVAMCRRDFDQAVSYASESWDRPGSRPMMAEYLAYRALGHACQGDRPNAWALAEEAERVHGSSVETATLSACAKAVSSLTAESHDGQELALAAFDLAHSTGGFDSLVTAGRACPRLLAAIGEHEPARDAIREVLARSNDFQLGDEVGLEVIGPSLGPVSELTRREVEVAELVTHGHTNRAIAERLFISESTVKVHVRHILRKLKARKRAEIAARIAAK
jgi:DNA-binding CsgD family transcriptional regulator